MPLVDRLAELECGIFLLAREDPGLEFLLTTNRIIRELLDRSSAKATFPPSSPISPR